MFKHKVIDDFLLPKHTAAIKALKFVTKDGERDIYKHSIDLKGKIRSTYGKASVNKIPDANPFPADVIKEFHDTYHETLMGVLAELAPEKVEYYSFTELNVVMTGKDHDYPIHNDKEDKLLSVVVYVAPESNEGTWMYDDKTGANARQAEWKENRAFIFSRDENTWHSYKSDGINNRLTLVYNLKS